MARWMSGIWDELEPETRVFWMMAAVVLTVGGISAAVLTWHQPARWVAAVAVGCGVSSVALFALALMRGANSRDR